MLSKKIIIPVGLLSLVVLLALSFVFFSPEQNSKEDNLPKAKEVLSARIRDQKPKPTRKPAKKLPTPTPTLTQAASPTAIPIIQTPTPSPVVEDSESRRAWDIRSVSSMKETKDKICNMPDGGFIGRWIDKAIELGVNYIAIETPYDNPSCGDALAYTTAWVNAIRAKGLRVWHRHMPLAFEGIYGVNKVKLDYLPLIADYIKNNPSLFAEGDIFTPIPEPQNGGIEGVTNCDAAVCQFSGSAEFNAWLRSAMTGSEQAFGQIGLSGKIKIGYFGFDGFVAWGDNNPDWTGILEDATVAQMGNITIDHYPEAVGGSMDEDLSELEARFPGIPIVIGEWGTIIDGDLQGSVQNTMAAAKKHSSVIGFNYWHMGMGGNEALINDDFTNRIQFDDVQSFFRN